MEKKLAACVNVIPGIISVYEWEGKIENDEEVLMMIKTRTSRIPELTEYVKTNHPYDVAEVITTSIEQGNQPYLDWLGKIVPEKSTWIVDISYGQCKNMSADFANKSTDW